VSAPVARIVPPKKTESSREERKRGMKFIGEGAYFLLFHLRMRGGKRKKAAPSYFRCPQGRVF